MKYFILKILQYSWVPVAHACNTSYLGGCDQEDHSLMPAQKKSLRATLPSHSTFWCSGDVIPNHTEIETMMVCMPAGAKSLGDTSQ
jgi:hypothetical protein